MQDKLHILEDLNMLYIRQIALSLEVPRWTGWEFVVVGQQVGGCSSIYRVTHVASVIRGAGHLQEDWRAGEKPPCRCPCF